MQKRFIVLTDFSSYSANLLRFAHGWSMLNNAQLLVAHHTTPMVPALADGKSRAAIVQATNSDAREKLENLVADVLPPGANAGFSVSHKELVPWLSALLAEPFDHLVFVGLKGTGLLKKIFIGSMALRVIEETDNIVVAMPGQVSAFVPGRIYVAVSDEHPLNVAALSHFLGFLGEAAGMITFFHMAEPGQETAGIAEQLDELTGLFRDRFDVSSEIYEADSAFGRIKSVINNKIDELLVVQKGSRLLSDQFFRTFLINELVYEGETPLVVLP